MTSKNYFITDKTNITSDDDLLSCMAHHRDYTKLSANKFGDDDKYLVKCNCDDPATSHSGTYLDGATAYTHTAIMDELTEANGWVSPDGP